MSDVDELEVILDIEMGHMSCPGSDSNPGASPSDSLSRMDGNNE